MDQVIYFAALRAASAITTKDLPGLPTQSADASSLQTALKVVFGIAGGVALIMVVIGGFKYVASLGNAQNVAKAKDTILYAIIGLVACILAYSIVGLVVKKVA